LHVVIATGARATTSWPAPTPTAPTRLRDGGEAGSRVQDYNKRCCSIRKLAAAFLGRAEVFLTKGQFDFAILDYNQAISSIPRYPRCLLQPRHWRIRMQNQYERHPGFPNQVIDINPNIPAAFNNRCFARPRRAKRRRRCRIARKRCS